MSPSGLSNVTDSTRMSGRAQGLRQSPRDGAADISSSGSSMPMGLMARLRRNASSSEEGAASAAADAVAEEYPLGADTSIGAVEAGAGGAAGAEAVAGPRGGIVLERALSFLDESMGLFREKLHSKQRPMLVLEIHKDGERKFRTVPFRELFHYIASMIKEKDERAEAAGRAGQTDGTEGKQEDGAATAQSESKAAEAAAMHVHPPPPLAMGNRKRSATEPQSPHVGSVPDKDMPPRPPPPAEREPDGRSAFGGPSLSIGDAPDGRKNGSVLPPTRMQIRPRDIRRMGLSFDYAAAPTFLVRRHVLLVGFEPIRAIILWDRMIVLVPDGADSILAMLTNELRDLPENATVPFELRAIEAINATAIACIRLEHESLRPGIAQYMEHVRTATSPEARSLEALKSFEVAMLALDARIKSFVNAANLILDDEEDMQWMNLTLFHKHPEILSDLNLFTRRTLHREELELIFESFLQDLHSLQALNAQSRRQVVSAEALADSHMDSARNTLLTVDAIISLASMCVGLGSFIGSIFGMNLNSDSSTFLLVTIITSICCFLIGAATYAYLRRAGIFVS